MSTIVTIMRKWNNPQITIKLDNTALAIEMTLQDFLIALTDEVAEPLVRSIVDNTGSPLFWVNKKMMTDKLVQAIEGTAAVQQFVDAASRVLESVKSETSKVM